MLTLNSEALYFLKLIPILVGPTICFRWQNQANFVPPSYKLHNPHHPNPIRWLCQFTGTLNDFFNFSINFFFPSDDQKDHFCYKLNEMTENMGESPKQTEDDKVKCKVNQCFRMKYWSKLFTKWDKWDQSP